MLVVEGFWDNDCARPSISSNELCKGFKKEKREKMNILCVSRKIEVRLLRVGS